MPPPELPSVVAFAGRRIDAPDAEVARFPPARASDVARSIAAALRERQAIALVSSAACGADLLALGAAEEMGIRSRIVLPFAADRFRDSSVVDRGAEWGAPFDWQIERAAAAGELVVLEAAGEGSEAYAAANSRILDEAASLARELSARPVALVAWDGVERPGGDLTAAFARLARERGWGVGEVGSGWVTG